MGGKSKSVKRNFALLTLVSAACITIYSADHAKAASNIDYTLGDKPSTSLVWSTGGALSTVNGSNISVEDLIGINTPENSGVSLPFTDALFSFTSGTYRSNTGSFYNYSAGGTFKVVGSFDFNGNGNIDASETNLTLLSGTMGAMTLDKSTANRYEINNTALAITDYALASYFGYPSGTLFNGVMNLAFNVGELPEAFQGGGTDGDISTTPTSPVPVPAAAFLMFSGLAGLLGFRKNSSKLMEKIG